jgi:formylmethanofuran dehydrogenase subunit B
MDDNASKEELLAELIKIRNSICQHCKRVSDDIELRADGAKLVRLCSRCNTFFNKLNEMMNEPKNKIIMAKLREHEENEKNQ